MIKNLEKHEAYGIWGHFKKNQILVLQSLKYVWDDQIFFMSYYIINFSFGGKTLPTFLSVCQFRTNRKRFSSRLSKAEEFWLSVFELVFTFPFKVPNVKKIE